MKIDFESFFPSIRSFDWVNYCKRYAVLTEDDCHLTSKLLFKKEKGLRGLRLAIGAPSSPLISNILMHDFDEKVSQLVASENVVYTRYADDLTFSAPRAGYLVNVERQVRQILNSISYPRLKINNNKTVRVTAKYRRPVTGIILTNDGKTSVGRDRKRILSSGVHHTKRGDLDIIEMKRLSGHLAYVSAVEPEFLTRLEKKYGREIIDYLKKVGNPLLKS